MKKFILFFVFLIVEMSFANTPKLHLLHINGLNSIREKTDNNLRQYQITTNMGSSVFWDVVYNPTQSGSEWSWVAALKGFWDLCKQKWYESNQLPTLDEFIQQAMKAQGVDYPVGSPQYIQFQSMLIGQLQNLMLNDGGNNMGTIIDEFHNTVPAQYANVLSLINNYGQIDYSNTKDYVILLPHSQGNIYANNLYNYLTQIEHFDSSRISIFGYASPAKNEQGQMMCNASVSNYVTSTNDVIIAMSRLVFGSSSVLPNNITIPKNESETSGHGLIENYLTSRNSIDIMNSFLHITSNNCFKDLHSLELIGTNKSFPSYSRAVYDATSKYLMQINNNKQICELNVQSGNNWVCSNLPDNYNISPEALSGDGLGNIFMTGMDHLENYLFTFKHNVGIVNTESLGLDTFNDFNSILYYKGFLYSRINSHNKLYSVNLNTKEKNTYDIFNGIQLYDDGITAFDDNNNIYTFNILTYPYIGSSQIIRQSIGEDMYYQFAVPIPSRINDMIIINNILYVCGVWQIYYLPLNSLNNQNWLTLNFGCDHITGDGEYLFTIDYNNIYKYKL